MPRTNAVGTTPHTGSGAQRCAQAGEREHITDSTARSATGSTTLPTRKCSHCGERFALRPRRGRNSGKRHACMEPTPITWAPATAKRRVAKLLPRRDDVLQPSLGRRKKRCPHLPYYQASPAPKILLTYQCPTTAKK